MNNMQKEFIPYELALRMKLIGFDEPCLMGYFKYTVPKSKDIIQLLKPLDSIYGENYLFKNSSEEFKDNSISGDGDGAKCSAPTYSQSFSWFRDKHGLYGYPFSQSSQTNFWFKYFIQQEWKDQITSDSFNTHEEAELACLNKLIELIENK